MEVVDFNLNDLEPITLNLDDDIGKSYGGSSGSGANNSLGPGIELLMNDKKRSSSNNVHVDLGELDNLENELNELSSKSTSGGGGSNSSGGVKTLSGLSGFASNLFGFGKSSAKSSSENMGGGSSGGGGNHDSTDSNLGHATKETIGSTKTWDGYAKFNDIPDQRASSSAGMSERDRRRKKRHMIKKLEEWSEKGFIKSGNHFTLDSPYDEVEDEYETALEDKRKKDSVKLQGWWFMTFVNSVEYANAAFNPFDINLDGWGEQVSEDIDSYDEIFTELHEKYKGGKMAPELSLLLRLGFSAAMVNFTNKALSSATPGFNDVIKQSPELMKMFTNATVSSMSQQSPGFAFANNLINKPDEIKTSFGPPPAPVETKNQPPLPRPGAMGGAGMGMQYTQPPSANRQDINMARGNMFSEEGVSIQNNYASTTQQDRNMRPPQQQQHPSQHPMSNGGGRPEMRGPQNVDIDNILSGLKTRTVNIHENVSSSAPVQSQSQSHASASAMSSYQEDDSMISIASLKDLHNTNLPKKTSRRKNKSDKNTISLDI